MNKVAIIASLAAGLALQQVANATAVIQNPISIYRSSGGFSSASGSFDQALLSSNSKEYIGCQVGGNYSYSLILCEARDAAGQYTSCYIDSPSQTLLQIASAINEYSYIEFAADDSYRCFQISVDNATYNK